MNQPIVIRDVEVTTVNPLLKTFSIVVHVKAQPIQMKTPEVQDHIASRVQYAVKYLVDEGFIPEPEKMDDWKCVISGVCHPPQ